MCSRPPGRELAASIQTVGVAVARGDFRLDGSSIHGNATVLDGSALETSNVVSVVQLKQGGSVTLGEGARVKMFNNHMELEHGVGQVSGTSHYPIDVSRIRIQPADGSQARVRVADDKQILVAAMIGPVHVSTMDGVMLANIVPGATMAFAPQGAVGATSLSGQLTKSGGTFLLKDHTTGIVFQVSGCNDLAGKVNKTVSVTGTVLAGVAAQGGASQVLEATCLNVSAVNSSGSSASVPAPHGAMSILGGNHKTIITGIVVAGVATGIALGLELSKDSSTTSR